MTTEQERAERWLQRLIGEWMMENYASAAPGTEPELYSGHESVRALGGTWVVLESRTTEPASAASTTMMTLGYDATRARVVGVVATSMMSNLWIYDGALDEDGEGVTLECDGPSFIVEGATGRYRDTMRFKSDTERLFTSSYLGADGVWQRFMNTTYRRVRPA
jgi:Protein of unknown function (DUF1579)